MQDIVIVACLLPGPVCTIFIMGHRSPAKIFRAVKFLERKRPLHTRNVLPCINIPPVKPRLSIHHIQTTEVPSQTQHNPILVFSKTVLTSFVPDIPPTSYQKLPNPQYHPNILEASRLMYGGNQPQQITPDESEHFRRFQQLKIESLYNP